MFLKYKLYYQFSASIALLLFVFLGYTVKFYPALLLPFDQKVAGFIEKWHTPATDAFFNWITKFGNVATIALIVFVLFVMLFQKNYKIEAVWLFINTALIAGAGNFLVKLVFNRERPSLNQMIEVNHSSFPSGHSMGSILLYGTLFFYLSFLVNKPILKRILQAILIALPLLIGISRIYLGVHYPSDIIGGFLLGLAWLLFSYPIYEKESFVYQFQKKTTLFNKKK